LAGDGRWKSYGRDGNGNPMAHAIMRAIGMVAQKLKVLGEDEGSSGEIDRSQVCHNQEQDYFLHYPTTPEEQAIYDSGQLAPNGYLCHGLEIYVTHEPCVACSMALLHSRFARVVFGHQMPRTGGLCSELYKVSQKGHKVRSLGHGLFWRKELNWSFLAWQTGIEVEALPLDPTIHV
jgi:tRNA-specific adenosine deaminase 3